jgi:hypothetical protein
MRICGMRTGIIVEVRATDREQLLAIVADRNGRAELRHHVRPVIGFPVGQRGGAVMLAISR